MDMNKDGKIEYSEFIVAAIDEKILLSEKRLKAAFDMFDKDKSGNISVDEIKKVLSFGKDIDEFLEDSEWDIESIDKMSQFSKGSKNTFRSG